MNSLDWHIIVTLYEQKNVTQAAEMLFMSQPTLTKRLQKIESEIGGTIAIRNKKGVTFTPAGEYLANQGQKIIELLEETTEGVNALTNKACKILRLGATNAFSRFFLPSILQRSQEFDDSIEFEVTTDVSSNIAKLVENKKLDAGFIFGDIAFDGIKHHLGVNHALIACNKPFALEDLPKMNRIDYSKDSFTKNLIDSWWHDHFTSVPRVAMMASNGDTCREMVLKGLGYAIFTVEEFVATDDRLYKLPMINVDGSPVVRDMWLICRSNYKKDITLNNFINSITKIQQQP